ncbi:S41 family peptidase [uncultured Erythrobacter sp.]|uniref:S41 family peptidase n=1 Tax=uncultured Erythrobacter sp. TaxID=263913 RepID=UPI0026112A4A|nr:S41 family peptidase [uncultured Erythrobacter sp.]
MKFLLTAIAAALISMTGCEVAAQDTPAPSSPVAADATLTPAQVRSDIELAKEAFSRVHPGYTRYASEQEMDAAWQAVIDRAEQQGGMTLPEFYLASELVLVKIRCDHTKAELPRSLRKARKGQPLYLPFKWVVIEGRGLIESPAAGLDLVRGDEILAIDGKPLSEVLDSVAGYIPVDGYTEWSRNGGLAASLEFMGGAVDHFGALMGEVPATATVRVRSDDGTERDTQIGRISFSEWSELGEASIRNFKDAVTYKQIGGTAGYLSVDTFVNYREPVKPKTIYEPVFKAIRDQGIETLILDLRSNGGGSSDANYGLLANLLTEPFKPRKEMVAKTLDLDGIRPYLWTWDKRALKPNSMGFSKKDDGTYALRRFVSSDLKTVKPAKYAFEGKLIVLTSNDNSSGSTNFITWMKEIGRAVTVGEKTGGSSEGPTAGLQFTLTLPASGVRMRLPFFHVKNNVASFERGYGVTPDVSAPMTVDAFRAQRDPALEMAEAIAKGSVSADTAASQATNGAAIASVSDFAMLEGDNWSGELDYLNYGRDDRSSIPVRMVARAPEGGSMAYGFIYPGEEDKNANDRLQVSPDGKQINGMDVIDRYVDEAGALVLVTRAEGSDDGEPAVIRLTYIISSDQFVTRKDVKFDGGEFFNRNEYRLTR